MKKALFLLAVLLVLLVLPSLNAAFTPYCDEYPTQLNCVCRQNIVYDDFGEPLSWSLVEETKPASNWFDMYCLGTAGTIRQQRVVLEIVKPACKSYVETRQFQETPRDYCAKCLDPVSMGSWQVRQCIGSKTLYQKSVVAYYYDLDVLECKVGQWLELKLEETGACSDPNTLVLPIVGELPPIEVPFGEDAFIIPIVFVISIPVLIVIIILAVLFWRHRK